MIRSLKPLEAGMIRPATRAEERQNDGFQASSRSVAQYQELCLLHDNWIIWWGLFPMKVELKYLLRRARKGKFKLGPSSLALLEEIIAGEGVPV